MTSPAAMLIYRGTWVAFERLASLEEFVVLCTVPARSKRALIVHLERRNIDAYIYTWTHPMSSVRRAPAFPRSVPMHQLPQGSRRLEEDT
ncbi:hypothetical protein DACRYDRAFT_92158 [Dacryopinax primogenitus]|uniref:Uncharacterized protein n=1 Tax=Dacryopinax primogenitus (strain DJM 731) TaxID=1858805 RepID=M5FT70_DACPD|nr:uncharacterized protein DACRYDRAFT_92158 [Dacryopinax primogenitus]EJT96456.1 hypothetical protein DACRYDRAFT_92158 [Dacryopinax primogenitus]